MTSMKVQCVCVFLLVSAVNFLPGAFRHSLLLACFSSLSVRRFEEGRLHKHTTHTYCGLWKSLEI